MTEDEKNEQTITRLRNVANVAEQDLKDFVIEICPGDHMPVQHRDHKPPWCRFCGRTSRGLLIKE